MEWALGSLDIAQRMVKPFGPGAFRLWLALAVVVHHLTRWDFGKAPVLVFFALSGFWVHLVWHRRYVHAAVPWFVFVVSRWWRIVPLLLLVSAVSLTVHALCASPDWAVIRLQPWAQALKPFIVLGYAQLGVRPVGPAWSLDVEMQFYLLAPLLIALVDRLSRFAVMGLGYLSFVLALAYGWRAGLAPYLIFFLIGLLAARHDWRVPAAMGRLGMVLAVVCLLLAVLLPGRDQWLYEGGDWNAPLNLGLAGCLLPFALMTVRQPSDKVDRIMGDFSYLIYLVHWPAIIFIRFGLWGRAMDGLSLLLAALACFAIWRWIDRPLERRRARWVRVQTMPGAQKRRKRGDSPTHFA